MNLIRIYRKFPRIKQITIRYNSQVAILNEHEYTESPIYPPIMDLSFQSRRKRKCEELYEKIKNINTVEEKQIALNMPRYYGWVSVIFNENVVPYNALPLIQFFTRTYFKSMDQLPEMYGESNIGADEVAQEIKSQIEDAILIENEGVEYQYSTCNDLPEAQQIVDAKAKRIVKQINRIISNSITEKASHIISTQVDYDPRHEAFWFVGGSPVPPKVLKFRQLKGWKDRLHEPIDRPVQYFGKPLLTLRYNQPLRPLLPYSEAENPEFKVEKFPHLPETVGYFVDYKHGVNIPGYWPGDLDEYGLLSYHGSGHIVARKKSFGAEDNLEALHCQAIKASFGWLLAQANFQGFTTYNDVTYPLATQTILTDGQQFSFYLYQLNTIEMHNYKVDSNPKHNICFGMKPMKLYDTIENGQIKGLNTDVLKMLVQLYLNAPEERDHDMKPYLNKEEQIVADIEDDNKRCWLESTYKHVVSNRPKHYLTPEIYLWEKIYKIQHNTRFFEARRRPFEFKINEYKRRLDDHLPPYIPKVLRPYPRSRKKFETTYYPKV